jgi:muramoyltetrapeptide carboxypeptidase
MYAVDRLLWQMANASQLKGVAGVRLGAISDVQATIRPGARSWRR